MAANNRIIYAVQQMGMAPVGTQNFTPVHGLQNCGVTTNFRLDHVFEFGQLYEYDAVENVPDVEMTAEKVLDGYCPMWLLATQQATTPTLANRGNQKTIASLAIFSDDQDNASGIPIAETQCSGLVPSVLGYRLPVDGNCVETITLIGITKVWNTGAPIFLGAFSGTDFPLSIGVSGGVQRRQDVLLGPAPTGAVLDINGQAITNQVCILPPDVDGVNSNGTVTLNPDGSYTAHLQHINVNANLSRDDIFELGRKGFYGRFLRFPIPVTCEIEIIATKSDNVSATEFGNVNGASNGNNLLYRSIRLRLREGLFIDLGTRNKLESVVYGRGDTGGGHATVTYRYANQNFFQVQHPQDPNVSLRYTPV